MTTEDKLFAALTEASDKIYKATQRAPGNWAHFTSGDWHFECTPSQDPRRPVMVKMACPGVDGWEIVGTCKEFIEAWRTVKYMTGVFMDEEELRQKDGEEPRNPGLLLFDLQEHPTFRRRVVGKYGSRKTFNGFDLDITDSGTYVDGKGWSHKSYKVYFGSQLLSPSAEVGEVPAKDHARAMGVLAGVLEAFEGERPIGKVGQAQLLAKLKEALHPPRKIISKWSCPSAEELRNEGEVSHEEGMAAAAHAVLEWELRHHEKFEYMTGMVLGFNGTRRQLVILSNSGDEVTAVDDMLNWYVLGHEGWLNTEGGLDLSEEDTPLDLNSAATVGCLLKLAENVLGAPLQTTLEGFAPPTDGTAVAKYCLWALNYEEKEDEEE